MLKLILWRMSLFVNMLFPSLALETGHNVYRVLCGSI